MALERRTEDHGGAGLRRVAVKAAPVALPFAALVGAIPGAHLIGDVAHALPLGSPEGMAVGFGLLGGVAITGMAEAGGADNARVGVPAVVASWGSLAGIATAAGLAAHASMGGPVTLAILGGGVATVAGIVQFDKRLKTSPASTLLRRIATPVAMIGTGVLAAGAASHAGIAVPDATLVTALGTAALTAAAVPAGAAALHRRSEKRAGLSE